MAGFLRAAAEVIEETGYERATMSAIAERAGSCIGSLYQYFPNKIAVMEALCAQYLADVEPAWTRLADDAPTLDPRRLAGRLAGLQAEIVTSHPVLLALLDVPMTPYMSRATEQHRGWVAAVLQAHRRRMPRRAALRAAAVVQQVSKGLLALYAQSELDEKAATIDELKVVLTAYLLTRLGPAFRGAREA